MSDPGFTSPFGHLLFGLRVVINDEVMSKTVEDWSGVRSRSRAERRRKRGFPQRIKYRLVPKQEALRMGDTVVLHSVVYRQLKAEIAARKPTP